MSFITITHSLYCNRHCANSDVALLCLLGVILCVCYNTCAINTDLQRTVLKLGSAVSDCSLCWHCFYETLLTGNKERWMTCLFCCFGDDAHDNKSLVASLLDPCRASSVVLAVRAADSALETQSIFLCYMRGFLQKNIKQMFLTFDWAHKSSCYTLSRDGGSNPPCCLSSP